MTVDSEVELAKGQLQRLQAAQGESVYWVSWVNDGSDAEMTWSCLFRCDYAVLSSALRVAERLLGVEADVVSVERRQQI